MLFVVCFFLIEFIGTNNFGYAIETEETLPKFLFNDINLLIENVTLQEKTVFITLKNC